MDLGEKTSLYPQSETRKSCSITTPLEKTFFMIIAILVVIGIALTTTIFKNNSENDRKLNHLKSLIKNESNTCTTESCIVEASNLLQSMDLSVDPCADFYTFVCGNWIKDTHLTAGLESQFTRLTSGITLRVKDILEDLQQSKILPGHKIKVRDFYKACLDEVSGERKISGVEEFLSDIEKFGGWPILENKEWNSSAFNWADLMVKFYKNGYIRNILFDVHVAADVKNNSRSLISIDEPSLGLRKSIYYIFPSGETLIHYQAVLIKIVKLLKGDLKIDQIIDDILAAFKIEQTIAKMITKIDMKFPEQYYNIMTLGELENFAAKIPWREILQTLLPEDIELTDDEKIMVMAPPMIKGLNDLLVKLDNDIGKKTLANYMFYRAAFHSARHLGKKFYDLINSFEIFHVSAPWQFCTITSVEAFPYSLAASYADKYTDNQTKGILNNMVENLRNELLEEIEHANWLDNDTKNYALLKVRKMEKVVGYQNRIMDDEFLDNYYKDVNITNIHFRNVKEVIVFKFRKAVQRLREVHVGMRLSDIHNLLKANAYYYPSHNAIIIPVGVLQDPMFAPGRPKYINYGSFGNIIGHELTHAFDSIGGLFDAEGSYRMWWSQISWKKFLKRAKCFEDQYNKYYMPDITEHINGTQTLAENIADNGGLLTAYNAYKKLLKEIGSEMSLPGLPYNEKQMFWISYASVWCRKQTYGSILHTVMQSSHTPSKFRIIGSLSNIKEFSEDFNCKLNSTMNPESKCSLWN